MALEQISINIASFNDADAGGNNYYAGAVYEIYNINDTLADIFNDAAGASQIPQDGISNVSDSNGRVLFYIDKGAYYALSGGERRDFETSVSSITLREENTKYNPPTIQAAIDSTEWDVNGGEVFEVQEYFSGLGGGGSWKTVTSGAIDNINKPNGTWIRQCDGVPNLALVLQITQDIYPIQFGAVGNWENTTTLQGIDNHPALQAALDLPDPLNIRSIRLTSGMYRISDTLVSTSNMGIYGDSQSFYGDLRRLPKEMGTVILADNNVTGNIIELNVQGEDGTDSARIAGTVQNITVVGNKFISGLNDPFYNGGVCQNALSVTGRTKLTIRDSCFMKSLNGIFGDTPAGLASNGEWLIDNCQVAVNTNAGIAGGFNDSVIRGGRAARNGVAGIVAGSVDLKIHGMYIDYNGDSGIAVRGRGTVIDSCIINFGNNYGISCFSDEGTKIISNNITDHSGGPGVVFFNTLNCSVLNNTIENNSGGAGIELTGDCADIKVDVNHIENNSGGTLKKANPTTSVNWGVSNTGDSLDFNVTNWVGFKGVRESNRTVNSTILASGTGASFSITSTGALPGMSAYIGAPSLPSNQIITSASVTSNDTVAVQVFNFSGSSQDVAGEYKVFLDSTDYM